MTEPSITYGHVLIHDLNNFFLTNTDYEVAGTADAGGDTTHTVDAERTEGDHFWNNYYIKYLSGDNAGVYRQITHFDSATDTLTHAAFTNTCDAGDTYIIGKWKETDANSIASWECIYKDYFRATVTPSADAQTANLEYHFGTNPYTSLYTKLYVRFKTSDSAANGVKAGIIVTYTDDTSTHDLGYNTSYTTTALSLTPNKYLDKIALKVTSDGATTGSHTVDFDFLLVCKGAWSFPYVNGEFSLDFPNRDGYAAIHGRTGDVTQYAGAPLAEVTISGDMDTGTGWHGALSVDGEVFYELTHEAWWVPFYWFMSDLCDMKARIAKSRISQSSQAKAQRLYVIILKEYRQSSASNEYYQERFGLV